MRTTSDILTKMRPLLLYGLSIVFVAMALCLSLVLRVPFGNPFWLFFSVAVIVSTWFGGKGPGWVAVGLSTAAVLYSFIPPYDSWILQLRDVPFFLAFVLCQLSVSWLVSWEKETEASLRRAHDDLEWKIAERTAELRKTNDILVQQMTQQRSTEEALQATRNELARVARITTLGELTAAIAHEVNQPLAAVVANSDACIGWLSHESPNLEEARAAADRAAQVATQVSAVIARIRSLINNAEPQKEIVSINKVIEQTTALAQGLISSNDVTLEVELAPHLPRVSGDSIQLQQVILNLIMNGIEAMTSSTDRPRRLMLRSQMQGADEVKVSVQDSGVGVRADIMVRLFEPFFTTRPKGIGMGLPISRSIIEAHGGKLWAESNGSDGSIFQFTLPGRDGRVA